MSVVVLSIQREYPEQFAQPRISFSTSESDSDVGYGAGTKKVYTLAASTNADEVFLSTTPADSSSDREGSEPEIDSELRERIIKQVEWYFSDENLLKDSFLMKHINRNQLGYVSLKLVASLRKVKTITKDWKLVQESLRHSELILNEEGTKVRRKLPAPQVDFSHISKTLLITEYPDEEPNLADLEQQFGRYGEVSQVRIILPGRAVPLDVKPCKLQYPSLGKDLCILVELESEDSARSAYCKIQERQSWRSEMKVQLLSTKKNSIGDSNEAMKDQAVVVKSEKKRRTKAKDSMTEAQSQSGGHRQSHSNDTLLTPRLLTGKDHSSSQSSRESTPTRHLAHHRKSQPSVGSSSHVRRGWNFQGSKCSPEFSRKHLRPDAWSNKDYSSDSGVSCGQRSPSENPRLSPELSRKFSGGGSASDISWRSSDKPSRDIGVIRNPMGPNGSRGFRQRISPISIAVHSY